MVRMLRFHQEISYGYDDVEKVRIIDLVSDTAIIIKAYNVFIGIAVGDVAYHKIFSHPAREKQKCHIYKCLLKKNKIK